MPWTATWGQVSPARARMCLRDAKCEVRITVSADKCDGWARSSSKCSDGSRKLLQLWEEELPRCWKKKHPGCHREWNPLFVSLEPCQKTVFRICMSETLWVVQFLFCLLDGDWFTDLESNPSPCERCAAFPVPHSSSRLLPLRYLFHT